MTSELVKSFGEVIDTIEILSPEERQIQYRLSGLTMTQMKALEGWYEHEKSFKATANYLGIRPSTLRINLESGFHRIKAPLRVPKITIT